MPDPLASVKQAQAQYVRDVTRAMQKATDQATEVIFNEMYEETSLADHTLTALRQMGHPYRREGEPGQPHADWLVHHQSGDLQEGLTQTPTTVMGDQIQAEIHSSSPYTWYLLLGTRFMRPRDFVSASLIQTKKAASAIYEQHFKSTLDVKGSEHYEVEIKAVPHDVYPAQLPEP